MGKIFEQLKGLKEIKPREDWVTAERGILMSQIKVQSARKQQSFSVNAWYFAKSLMPTKLAAFVVRPVGVLSIITFFVVSTGILSVNASRGSLPGDLFYSVKLTSEKVQVGFTAGEENKVKLHLNFAEKRASEIATIAKKDIKQEVKRKKVQVAAAGLTAEMKKAQNELDNVKEEIKNSGKDQKEKLVMVMSLGNQAEELSARLGQQKKELKGDKDLSKALSDAEEAVDDTSVKAVEVVVEKREQGTISLPEKELVDSIGKNIEKTEKRAEASQAAIAAVLPEVKSSDATESVKPEVSAGQKVIKAAILAKQEEAKKLLIEARDLLSQGDLASAMEKVKASAEITKEVKAAQAALEEQTGG